MTDITCQICRDLLPLVADGVASEDSVRAVEAHIAACPACAALHRGEAPPGPDPAAGLAALVRRLRLLWAMVLMFGVCWGLSLTAGSGLFRNIVLMPAIGALGYGLMGWRALYAIPALLLGTHLATNALGLGGEVLALWPLVAWTGYYCLFAALGTVIAGLLRFALGKEKTP